MAFDEARFGLFSWHKRRYCPYGHRPLLITRRVYDWTWFYAAVEPTSGEHFCLYLPRLDGACFEVFLHELSLAYPEDLILLIIDNASAHTKKDLQIPENIRFVFLPPYSPECNPAERWFLEFRRALANHLFDSIDDVHAALSKVLADYTADPELLSLLTDFPWWWFGVAQFYDDMNQSV